MKKQDSPSDDLPSSNDDWLSAGVDRVYVPMSGESGAVVFLVSDDDKISFGPLLADIAQSKGAVRFFSSNSFKFGGRVLPSEDIVARGYAQPNLGGIDPADPSLSDIVRRAAARGYVLLSGHQESFSEQLDSEAERKDFENRIKSIDKSLGLLTKNLKKLQNASPKS
jgi:hypothetical protein